MINEFAIVPHTGPRTSSRRVAPVSPAGRHTGGSGRSQRRTFRYTPPHPADRAGTYGAQGRLRPGHAALTGIIIDLFV